MDIFNEVLKPHLIDDLDRRMSRLTTLNEWDLALTLAHEHPEHFTPDVMIGHLMQGTAHSLPYGQTQYSWNWASADPDSTLFINDSWTRYLLEQGADPKKHFLLHEMMLHGTRKELKADVACWAVLSKYEKTLCWLLDQDPSLFQKDVVKLENLSCSLLHLAVLGQAWSIAKG